MGRISNRMKVPAATWDKSLQRVNKLHGYVRLVFGMVLLTVFTIGVGQHYVEVSIRYKMPTKTERHDNHMLLNHTTFAQQKEPHPGIRRRYLVLWNTVLQFISKRPETKAKDFSTCEYNNCELTFKKSLRNISDAVMFDGRYVKKRKKIPGQVWIFAAHESQWLVKQTINSRKSLKRPRMESMFNWTMTFDKTTADIWLPYGEIKKRTVPVVRDFLAIAKNKTKGALIITSHCQTKSKRMEFINELKEHTDVTVLGMCGTEWDCGHKSIHDNCFDILNNTYAYYLAFENALCDNYFTEKLFDNFKYDILIVSRGGGKGISSTRFPTGSVISTDSFTDAKHLGSYLTYLMLSKEEYAKRLEEKSQYYAVDYADVYQKALCELCYRLNHQEKFHKVIPDISRVFSKEQMCALPEYMQVAQKARNKRTNSQHP